MMRTISAQNNANVGILVSRADIFYLQLVSISPDLRYALKDDVLAIR